MTRRQKVVTAKVIRAKENGRWYRAEGNGERVTLASLYRAGVLVRRCHRGKEGEADAAHEYYPSKVTLDAWEALIAKSRALVVS